VHRVPKVVFMTATIMLNPGLLTALPAAPSTKDAAPWSATIAAPGEPGTRLIVRGRVTASDGRTPVAGAALLVWQTDTHGHYAADGSLGEPRLSADLTTGENGEYELLTIRPAAYPNRSIPAHIHYRVTHGDQPQEFEVRFDDDPLVTSGERERSRREGRFGTVQRVSKGEDGILEVTKDLKLR
jgi:protocatechuate 3,4-dioxygenase, beta subunit